MTTKWLSEDIKQYLEEFHELYQKRPIIDNSGGMKSAHMFSAWYIVKKLQPKYIIESGVWKGLGTWFFEQACPSIEKIYSIDPNTQFRIYTSPKAEYQTNDFLHTDWSHINKNETFVFFDDHQNCLSRLQKCVADKFKYICIEDNYPWQQGDCYTPKKILANRDYIIDANGERSIHPKKDNDLNFLKQNFKHYQEMYPIFKSEKTRWNDIWDDEYPTPEPLLKNEHKEKYPIFFNERLDYTWICYLEI